MIAGLPDRPTVAATSSKETTDAGLMWAGDMAPSVGGSVGHPPGHSSQGVQL